MSIYGSTADATLTSVGLLIGEVAENMIDPWRIDLADPEPVVERSDKPMYFRTRPDAGNMGHLPPLAFRRLRDVCFAYCDEQGTIFVGVHDGVEPYCVSGKQGEGAQNIELTDVEISKKPFSEHFAAYLQQCHAVDTAVRRDLAFRMTPPQFNSPNPPRAASAAKLRGNTLTVHRDAQAVWESPIKFVGEMFTERSFPLPMSDDIKLLLDSLKEWEPIVYGRAIRDCLKERKTEAVDISVKAGYRSTAVRCLRHRFHLTATHEDHDVSYPSSGLFVSFRGMVVRVAERHPNSQGEWMRSNPNFYSVDHMWACRPNEGWASRIALIDFGHSRARALSDLRQHTRNGTLIYRHEDRLRKEKIVVINTPVA
jgi:hypothetical protein